MKPIKTWDEVDEHVALLGKLDLIMAEIKNEMDRKCQEIKERCGLRIKTQETVRDEVLDLLNSFFRAHEDDFEVKGKTFEGMYGKCGFRMTPPSVKPVGRMSWERVLARIIELGYKSKFLRPLVHSIKDIDRELLASEKITDDVRKAIGVKLHQEERFWYEAK